MQATSVRVIVFVFACAIGGFWVSRPVVLADEANPTAKSDGKSTKSSEKDDELTPDILAKRLEFDWSQISAQANRTLKQNSTSRSINIYGQVKILKELDILALGQQTEVIEAVDENGNDLRRQMPSSRNSSS